MQEKRTTKNKKFKKEVLVKREEEIKPHRGRQPQFTTMNVIDGQADLILYTSLIFYSLTIDNILNIVVMLILVGVTISLSLNGGLFGYAKQAVKETENARDQELDLANGDIINYYAYGREHDWKRTGDTFKCSHCDAEYEMGQEMSYKADTVTTPYTLTAKKSGIEETGLSKSAFDDTPVKVNENGDQTISQEKGLTWVVLGIDDEDGDGRNESLLITTSEVLGNGNTDNKTRIIFYGCNNVVDELNNICEALYSNATYGKARSMTIDDVNTCLNYTPVGAQYYNGTEVVTTGNLTTKLRDLPTWESIKEYGTYTLY